MIIKMYAIKDVKAQAFLKPIFAQNDEVAKRLVETALKDKSTELGMSPHDYNLYSIGEYNDADAKIVSMEPIEILRGVAVKQEKRTYEEEVKELIRTMELAKELYSNEMDNISDLLLRQNKEMTQMNHQLNGIQYELEQKEKEND